MEKSLIANPYKNGQILMHLYQIEKSLFMDHQNHQELEILFEELVLQHVFEKMPVYTDLFKADENCK